MNNLSGEIITMLNKKQEAAFEVAFKMYYPRLVYFAKEYISAEDAKNLVQDAFVSFWEKKPQLLTEYQLQSYLYTAVKNNCLMLLRHEKIKKNYSEKIQIQIQNQLYSRALEELDTSANAFKEIETIIERTLTELPDRCREVFILSRYEGKKNDEIALLLNISVKAVEAQITKGLKKFKIALKDFLPILAFIFIFTQ